MRLAQPPTARVATTRRLWAVRWSETFPNRTFYGSSLPAMAADGSRVPKCGYGGFRG
jgi:hypothetical protein